MVTTQGSRVGIRVSSFTKLDPSLEAGLLSFYGWLGLTDVYWHRVRRALHPGPALLVCAHRADWPKVHEPDSLRAVLYGRPYDRTNAELSNVTLGSQHKIDVGVMAALYASAFTGLQKLGMKQMRFEVPARFSLLRRHLTDAGFMTSAGSTDSDLVRLVAPITDVAAKLGLSQAKPEEFLNPDFGATPAHDRLISLLTVLQLGSLREPPGTVVNPGIFASPDGDPPDGGPPEPGVPPDPPSPPPGPDAGLILRGGLEIRTRGR